MQFYNTGRRLAPTLDVSQSEIKLEADYFDYVKDPSSFQIRSGSEIFVSISEVESAADDLKTSPLRQASEKCKKASVCNRNWSFKQHFLSTDVILYYQARHSPVPLDRFDWHFLTSVLFYSKQCLQ